MMCGFGQPERQSGNVGRASIVALFRAVLAGAWMFAAAGQRPAVMCSAGAEAPRNCLPGRNVAYSAKDALTSLSPPPPSSLDRPVALSSFLLSSCNHLFGPAFSEPSSSVEFVPDSRSFIRIILLPPQLNDYTRYPTLLTLLSASVNRDNTCSVNTNSRNTTRPHRRTPTTPTP